MASERAGWPSGHGGCCRRSGGASASPNGVAAGEGAGSSRTWTSACAATLPCASRTPSGRRASPSGAPERTGARIYLPEGERHAANTPNSSRHDPSPRAPFLRSLLERSPLRDRDRLVAPHGLLRGTLGATVQGPQGLVDYARELVAAFPNIRLQIDELIVDRDRAAAQVSLVRHASRRAAGLRPDRPRDQVRLRGAVPHRARPHYRGRCAWRPR